MTAGPGNSAMPPTPVRGYPQDGPNSFLASGQRPSIAVRVLKEVSCRT